MVAVEKLELSFEEYVKLEQETDTKYEFHDGEVFAMAGGTIMHSLISGNIYGEFFTALKIVIVSQLIAI